MDKSNYMVFCIYIRTWGIYQ